MNWIKYLMLIAGLLACNACRLGVRQASCALQPAISESARGLPQSTTLREVIHCPPSVPSIDISNTLAEMDRTHALELQGAFVHGWLRGGLYECNWLRDHRAFYEPLSTNVTGTVLCDVWYRANQDDIAAEYAAIAETWSNQFPTRKFTWFNGF